MNIKELRSENTKEIALPARAGTAKLNSALEIEWQGRSALHAIAMVKIRI